MNTKRGLFFAFLCAAVVGVFSLALIAASFARPAVIQSLLFGQGNLSRGLASGDFSGSNAEVVTKANPGVVTVVATRAIPAGEDSGAGEIAQEGRVQRGTGAGFIVDPEGLVVTNQHVIANADRIRVKLHDGRTQAATLVGADNATDLALLRIDVKNLTPLRLGDSDALRVGDSVIAIGNPLEYERSVTAGIVSALGRKVYEAEPAESFIQTDAAINRGNSGGPLLNKRGEVIGVNTVIRSDGRGISFAVPSNVVNHVVTQLRVHGYVARGYLGLAPVSLTPELREGLGLGDLKGVVVADVSKDFPAERAGIRPYDVVTHFNGRSVAQAEDFFSCVANSAPQERVEITVVRGGHSMKFYPTLDQRPIDVAANSPKVRPASDRRGQAGGQNGFLLGFSVRENTPDTLRELRIGKLSDGVTGGVVVSDIDPLGPAADTRLATGFVILEANRKPIRSLEDFQKATSPLREGDILVIRFTNPHQRAIQFAAIKVGES
ncbi:MAG TPA: trypsin-like peptidase domain-containing protein [Blastocatellia bacterium]|nr:trypsin-like peptidase domain-containing protein [Blastocatellia bacterium]